MNKIVIGEHITKSFGGGAEKTIVLDDVSVQISAGEFVAIMGASGSGKTTLLFALSGMDTIDNGNVIFDGQNLASMKENALADLRRTRMGFVFQQPTLLKNLNLLDNIVLPTQRGNEKNAKQLKQKAQSLMDKLGLKGLESREVTQVSGGQLQRAGICRALMADPDILFGDEPTGALNSKTAQEIMDILKDIHESGKAILLVTHDVKVAAQAQRVLYMRDGTIVHDQMFQAIDAQNLEARIAILSEKMREIDV